MRGCRVMRDAGEVRYWESVVGGKGDEDNQVMGGS